VPADSQTKIRKRNPGGERKQNFAKRTHNPVKTALQLEIPFVPLERPRRVLHVLASLDQRYGGPLRAVLDLCAAGESLGVHSEILGMGELNVPDNPFPSERIHSLPATGSYRYSPELRPWLRAHLDRFDGVVLHGLWCYPNWAAAVECQAAGKPYGCFPHGMLEPWAVSQSGQKAPLLGLA
jgi:hypothetical protein